MYLSDCLLRSIVWFAVVVTVKGGILTINVGTFYGHLDRRARVPVA